MSTSPDPFDLDRFVQAQAAHYADAIAELQAGRKTTHWSWYVLPQLAGLGTSPMARRYAIASLDEARAYLAHPVLGPRLHACVSAINGHPDLTADAILGPVDAMKFRSCLTLFLQVAPEATDLQAALDTFFGGERDPATLSRLAGGT